MSSSAESSPQASSSQSEQPQSATQFLYKLKESGSFEIGTQSILDALDLWISSLKYYFDAMNPASGSLSSKMFFEWLHSEEGLIVFLLGSLFFGVFAYLGNGVKKEDKTEFSKIADTYWPYVRDVIKRLKWTFKGTRSLLLVTQTLFKQNYISYITPAGIILGVVGAVNQLWNRNMVETRKSLQESNDLFRRRVKGINACLLEINDLLLPEDEEERQKVLKHIYAGSILILNKNGQKDYLMIDENGNEKKFSQCLENFSADQQKTLRAFLNQLETVLEKLREDASGQTHVPRIYWEQYKKILESNQMAFEAAGITPENNPFWKIYHDKQKFIQNEILKDTSETRKYLINAAQFQKNSKQAFASAILSGLLNAPYYFLGVLSMVVLPAPFFIYAVAACSFFMILNVISEYDQEADYQRRLKISQLKANLIMNKRLLLLEWQNFNHNELTLQQDIQALLDLTKENPSLHRLILSKFPTIAGVQKTDLSAQALSGMDLSKLADIQLEGLTSHQQDILSFCVRVENLEREYLKNHLDLSTQLKLSSGVVWRQSLRNGLVVYGAFNSLLMTIATMSFLFGLTITPIFFYVSILVGFSILIATMTYTWLFIRPKEEKNINDLDDNAEQLGLAQAKELTTELAPKKVTQDNTLYVSPLTYDIMNIPEIRGSSNLLIPEHAEVFRQTLSGAKKGIKSTQTILPLLVTLAENINPALMITYLGISMGYAYFFASKGLRGLMRVDNEAFKESFMYCTITGEKRPSELAEQAAQASTVKTTSRFFKTGSSATIQKIGSHSELGAVAQPQ